MESYLELEQQWSRWAGAENVVACSSGTAALHLAMEALQLPYKSFIVMPNYTMIACARAAALTELNCAFADGFSMCPDSVERLVDKHHASAILAVHVYGRSCNMDALADIADKYDLALIEDLAEAHGLPVHPRTDAACWSFYKNKVVGGEEGGAVSFKDRAQAALARELRSLGFTSAHNYRHTPKGHNYRLSNIHAELILDSLGRVKKNLSDRRMLEEEYDKHCPAEWRRGSRDVPWVYDVQIPGMTEEMRAAVVSLLRANGIQARAGFVPMQEQLEFSLCPNELTIPWEEVLYLPLVNARPPEIAFNLIASTLNLQK